MGLKRAGSTPEAQQELPGVMPEIVKIAAVTKALKALKFAKAEYQKAGLDAKDANVRALALFHEHQLTTYKTAWGWVTLKPGKEKLEFETGKDEGPEDVDGQDVSDE